MMQYNNYNIDWSNLDYQINLSFVNNITEVKYEKIIHEQDIKIGSIKKFIIMLKNCINLVKDYNMEISENENELNVMLNYNSDLLDLDEIIILHKLSVSQIDSLLNQNSKLKKRIEQLESKITFLENIPNILDFIDYSDIIKYGNIYLLEYMKNRGCEFICSGYEYQQILQNLKPSSIKALEWLKDNNYNFSIDDLYQIVNLTMATSNANCESDTIIEILQWFKNNFSNTFELNQTKILSCLCVNHKKCRLKVINWLCVSTNLIDYTSIIKFGNIQMLNLLKSKKVQFNGKELQTLFSSELKNENILEIIKWLSSEKYFSDYMYTGNEYHALIGKINSGTIDILNLLHENGYNFIQYYIPNISHLIITSAKNLDSDIEIIKILNWLKEKTIGMFSDGNPHPLNYLLTVKYTTIIQWVEKNHPNFKNEPYFSSSLTQLYCTYDLIINIQERLLWMKNTYGLNTIKINRSNEKINLTNWCKDNGFVIQYV